MQRIFGRRLELFPIGRCHRMQHVLGGQIVSTRDAHIPSAALYRENII